MTRDGSPRQRPGPHAPGRTILDQSARAIAQSRDLELRVRAIAERVRTPEERAVEIVDAALDALGAAVAIAVRRTLDGMAVELVGAASLADDVAEELRRIPLDAPLPLTDAVRTGEAVYCSSRDELVARYPGMDTLAQRLDIHALAAVPVRYLGVLQGALTLGFPNPRTFSTVEQSALRALGTRYARALRESRLYFAERDARTAEAAARRAAEAGRTVAEAAARAQGDFVAVVSHELRTPLQAILGYSELLADGVTGELNATQEEFARRIALGSLSLLQIVENLLGFSAAQLGQQRLDVGTFDLGALIAEVVTLAEPLARHRAVVLRTDVSPILMTSDARRVRQIVTNLVGNAIKFTEHGEVVVSASTGAVIAIGDASRAPARVRIGVRDTGTGIDPSDLPHLFEPFWQASRTALTQTHGTGLGLSIVRQLARLLGGDVQVASTPGSGSTFTVELPLVAPGGERRSA